MDTLSQLLDVVANRQFTSYGKFQRLQKGQQMDSQKLLLSVAMTSLLAACGGSSDDSSGAGTTQQAASATITGFGSVYVNGVEWETNQAVIEIDDELGTELELKVGQVVTVYGNITADGTANADRIEYDADLEGPISAINLDENTIEVLGRVCVYNGNTKFDDDSGISSPSDLSVGDFVEINGHLMDDGKLLMVHVELEDDEGEVEIAGQVDNLNTDMSTFMIGSQLVDFVSANLEDFDGQPIEDGQWVEVEASSTLGLDGELVAFKVELEEPDYDYGDEFEVEGLIAEVNSGGSIMVSGITIQVPATVQYEYGTAADVVADAQVEVEGYVNGPGQYVATKIEFDYESNVEVEAEVQAVGDATITVLGIVFDIKGTTQYEDDSAMGMVYFDLSNFGVGDWVSVDAYTNGMGGNPVAYSVEREDADELVAIEGPVDRVDGDQIMMLGVTIDTSGAEIDGGSLATLQPGAFIEVEGLQTDEAAISALEVEIQD